MPKSAIACGEFTGHNLLGNRPDDFKATLDNITIYVRDTYGHDTRMALKAQKEAIIPHLEDTKDGASDSTKYI